MDFLTTITLLQLSVLILYVGIVWHKFGVLEALSTSAYKWEGDAKWYFMVFCWALGTLNFMQGLDVFGFWASVGLFATGITVNYREKIAYSHIIHGVGASSAIILSLIGLGVYYDMWSLSMIFVVGVIVLYTSPVHLTNENFNSDTRFWWIEIFAFLMIMAGYFLR